MLDLLPTKHAAIALLLFSLGATIGATRTSGDTLTRTEALAIAEAFRSHRWEAGVKNVLHGVDPGGIEVHTPDRNGGRALPENESWLLDRPNVGVAYKWGGFDTLASFDAGIRAGKAAGDVYTAEKRRRAEATVSGAAVGIDCSGFISRCWKLPRKYGTSTLGSICIKLTSPSELKAADIMNQAGGHVLLFGRWLDPEKKRALFFEAAPFSKVRAAEYEIAQLESSGFQPLRSRAFRD